MWPARDDNARQSNRRLYNFQVTFPLFYLCTSIYLSIFPIIYLSIYPIIYLSIYPYIFSSIYLSIHVYVCIQVPGKLRVWPRFCNPGQLQKEIQS